MRPIANVAESINDFFNLKAEEISVRTGFVKRKRKLTGASFVKALVLGNMGDSNCSIDAMCQILNEGSIEITKQGLDFRFTEVAGSIDEFRKRSNVNKYLQLSNKHVLKTQDTEEKTTKLLKEGKFKKWGDAYY